MFCPKCGDYIPKGSKQCSACGIASTPPSSSRPYASTASPASSRSPNTPPSRRPAAATYSGSYSNSGSYTDSPPDSSRKPKRLAGAIAAIVALIIFLMQVNWVVLNTDVGGVSAIMLADIVSQEALLEAMTAAGIADEAHLADAIGVVTDMLIQEMMTFITSIRFQYQNFSIGEILATGSLPALSDLIYIGSPPDIATMVEVLSDLVIWEVLRVTGNMGEIELSPTIHDIPNTLHLAELLVDMVAREGASWGLTSDEINRLATEADEALQMANQAVNILRGILVALTLLLALFTYLLVAGARPAGIFGQVLMALVFILSGAFVLGIFFGNQLLAEALNHHVTVSATWHVYAAVGLSALAFVLITLYKIALRGEE